MRWIVIYSIKKINQVQTDYVNESEKEDKVSDQSNWRAKLVKRCFQEHLLKFKPKIKPSRSKFLTVQYEDVKDSQKLL